MTVGSQPKEIISHCEDHIGRLFHCYHGTQPMSQYFTYPYERVRDAIYRKRRSLDFTDINVALIIFF